MQRSTFSFRAFVSTIMVWTFVTLVLSGVMLYVAPPGRIAHWTDWTLLGLTKAGWQAVHTLAALLFLLAGLFHLLKFNWGTFKAYLRRSREAPRPFRGAVLGGTMVFALVLAGTMAGVPPFSSVMEAGEWVTNAWAAPGAQPPVPHFELKTLEEAAVAAGRPLPALLTALRDAGIQGGQPDITLRRLADINRCSPKEIYTLITGESAVSSGDGSDQLPSRGLGRMTISTVAEQLGLSLDTAVRALANAGIEATAGETLRDVALRSRRRPDDIVAILQTASAGLHDR